MNHFSYPRPQTKLFVHLFEKVAGEPPDEVRRRGRSPHLGPQALLQAHFGGLGAFCKRKGPPWRARGRAFPALGKDEEAVGRFPGGKPPHGKRPFFSCKKGPKNLKERAFRPLRRAARGSAPRPRGFWKKPAKTFGQSSSEELCEEETSAGGT